MKHYRMRMTLSIVEVPDPASADPEPPESPDPVKQDANFHAEMLKVVKEQFGHGRPFAPPEPPAEQLSIRRTYDLGVQDFAGLPAVIEQIEKAAEGVGMLTSAPMPSVVYVVGQG
jgi:hypothetical protein